MIHKVIELSGLILGYKGMPDLTSHIHKSFNGPGIYAFVGRNGSGKSTLLRTILGLQSSVAGEVFIGEMNDGVSVKSLSFEKRAQIFAYVESTPPKTSGLRVAEVLQLANDMSSVGSGRDIELWGLENLMNRRLDTLSDGQALRVMFARASAQGASWILLDEPTAFLDIPSRKKLVQMLKEFSKTRGIIIATHDLHSLAEMQPVGVSEVCGFGLKDLEIKADSNEELVDKWEEDLGALLA
jgi:iron complex transport system ATP-binding protein|tara:strand:- start:3104 stop:3823 length:720 start_codon:yes stop_codon:yes gene_type:complete